jgi:predicted amidohydrolase YtcJ
MVKFDSFQAINPYNPFLAMWAAVTRKTERGTVIGASEAISRQEALKMYTINNAFGTFEENIKGSIEVGKYADLIVVSEDYMTCPVNKIKNMQVEMTMLGGKIVNNGN